MLQILLIILDIIDAKLTVGLAGEQHEILCEIFKCTTNT